jgi:hypothetical protein
VKNVLRNANRRGKVLLRQNMATEKTTQLPRKPSAMKLASIAEAQPIMRKANL